MTLEEKKLYHQIHPAKLFTDIVTGFGSVYLLWLHFNLFAVVCLAFIPSTIVSMILIAKTNLEKYKDSAFGTYLRRHMASKSSDWIRFGGFAVMLTGGWINLLWLIAVGFMIILFVWIKGLIFGKPRLKKGT
ncbi:MAG: hypothetical protein WBZ48_01285 [Bacteroidota bacterium]